MVVVVVVVVDQIGVLNAGTGSEGEGVAKEGVMGGHACTHCCYQATDGVVGCAKVFEAQWPPKLCSAHAVPGPAPPSTQRNQRPPQLVARSHGARAAKLNVIPSRLAWPELPANSALSLRHHVQFPVPEARHKDSPEAWAAAGGGSQT